MRLVKAAKAFPHAKFYNLSTAYKGVALARVLILFFHAELRLALFLNFEQKWASCLYKIVDYKQKNKVYFLAGKYY